MGGAGSARAAREGGIRPCGGAPEGAGDHGPSGRGRPAPPPRAAPPPASSVARSRGAEMRRVPVADVTVPAGPDPAPRAGLGDRGRGGPEPLSRPPRFCPYPPPPRAFPSLPHLLAFSRCPRCCPQWPLSPPLLHFHPSTCPWPLSSLSVPSLDILAGSRHTPPPPPEPRRCPWVSGAPWRSPAPGLGGGGRPGTRPPGSLSAGGGGATPGLAGVARPPAAPAHRVPES